MPIRRLFFINNSFVINTINRQMVKVGLSPSKKLFCLLPLTPLEKCFLFHLKSSFRSRDIYIFVLNFLPDRKNGLIRKMRLIRDVTIWLINDYNTHIGQYLTKCRQPNNEIWSSNTI